MCTPKCVTRPPSLWPLVRFAKHSSFCYTTLVVVTSRKTQIGGSFFVEICYISVGDRNPTHYHRPTEGPHAVTHRVWYWQFKLPTKPNQATNRNPLLCLFLRELRSSFHAGEIAREEGLGFSENSLVTLKRRHCHQTSNFIYDESTNRPPYSSLAWNVLDSKSRPPVARCGVLWTLIRRARFHHQRVDGLTDNTGGVSDTLSSYEGYQIRTPPFKLQFSNFISNEKVNQPSRTAESSVSSSQWVLLLTFKGEERQSKKSYQRTLRVRWSYRVAEGKANKVKDIW